jgi:hypothetical protein
LAGAAASMSTTTTSPTQQIDPTAPPVRLLRSTKWLGLGGGRLAARNTPIRRTPTQGH